MARTTTTTHARTCHPLTAAIAAAATAILACSKGPTAPEIEADPARLLVGILGTCASAVRDVQVRRAGQTEWEPVTAGAVFRVGDDVRTGPRSFARIAFLTGGGLELEDSSAVALNVKSGDDAAARAGARPPLARSSADEGRISVKAGVVRGVLPASERSASPGGLVIVSGDGSEIRIAGRPGEEPARFRLVRQDLGTELTIVQGAASVKGATGETVLTAGQVALARGGDLTERADLVQAPPLLEPAADARFQIVPGLSIRLRWKQVPGATGYLIQLAHDLSFREVERQEAVAGTEFSFTPAAAGVRAWRVAARDASGRLGEYGAGRRIHVEVRAPRDLLLKPADATVVKAGDRASNVTLSWQGVGEAAQYRVVLARSPELTDALTNAVVGGDHTVVEIAEPGEYWWGVYVEDEGDPRPLFTKPRRLTVRKAADARPRAEPRSDPRMEVPRAISQWGN